MNADVCLAEFEKLAGRLNVTIRYTGSGPSGLCTVKGERVIFLDRKLDSRGRIKVFVRDFKTLDMEGIFVVPIIRKLLDLDVDNEDW